MTIVTTRFECGRTSNQLCTFEFNIVDKKRKCLTLSVRLGHVALSVACPTDERSSKPGSATYFRGN